MNKKHGTVGRRGGGEAKNKQTNSSFRLICFVFGSSQVTPQASLSGTIPPNSAIISCATEGALFISAHLSTDSVSALPKVWVLMRLWKQLTYSVKART